MYNEAAGPKKSSVCILLDVHFQAGGRLLQQSRNIVCPRLIISSWLVVPLILADYFEVLERCLFKELTHMFTWFSWKVLPPRPNLNDPGALADIHTQQQQTGLGVRVHRTT